MRDAIGHEQAWLRLAGAFAHGQVHHAYLLAGPEGVGKTAVALDFARLLLCERPAGSPPQPCGECASCRRILHGNHPDVTLVEIEEGKRLLGVDTLRETVVRMANLAPGEGAWRVFVVPAVERMTPSTINALLKTLEEPPPGVVIVLTSSEPASLLPTLLSRCQLISLQPLDATGVQSALEQRWQTSPDEAQALAALANGRLGWAVRAHEHPELRAKRAETLARLVALTSAERDERLRAAADLAADAETARETVRLWTQWWRDVTIAACGGRDFSSTSEPLREAQRQGRTIGPESAEAFLRKLVEAQAALDQNANPRLTLDVLLLDLPAVRAHSPSRR